MHPVRVFSLALASRIMMLFLFLLGDAAFEDYDTSSSASLIPPCNRLLPQNIPHETSSLPSDSSSCSSEESCSFVAASEDSTTDSQEATSYDSDKDRPACNQADPPDQHPKLSSRILQSLVVWDGVFMVRIARCGYLLEQWHAFMPGVPSLLLLSAKAWQHSLPKNEASVSAEAVVDNEGETEAVLAASGLIVSNLAFVLAAVVLHRLSVLALGPDSRIPTLACILYCFSPASAFFSSLYTESLFGLLSFGGMLLWLSLYPLDAHGEIRVLSWRLPAAAALFAASSVVRSNGVLHSGFFFYSVLRELSRTTLTMCKSFQGCEHNPAPLNSEQSSDSMKPGQPSSLPGSRGQAQGVIIEATRRAEVLVQCVLRVMLLLACAAACFVPFATFQATGYKHFCQQRTSVKSSTVTWGQGGKGSWLKEGIEGVMLKWLDPLHPFDPPHVDALPSPRHSSASEGVCSAELQDDGTPLAQPLRCATPFQRPWCNSPVPYLYGFVQKEYWDVGFLRYFQLKQSPNFLLAAPSLFLGIAACVSFVSRRPILALSLGVRGKMRRVQEESGLFSAASLPFFVEMGFMCLVATFVMHAQVATRFLASCPALYWYGAHVLIEAAESKEGSWMPFWAACLVSSWLLYWTAGSLMFVNFYPFT